MSAEGAECLLLHILQWLHCKAHPQSCTGQEPPATAALQTLGAAGCFPVGVGSLFKKVLPADGLLFIQGIFLSFSVELMKAQLVRIRTCLGSEGPSPFWGQCLGGSCIGEMLQGLPIMALNPNRFPAVMLAVLGMLLVLVPMSTVPPFLCSLASALPMPVHHTCASVIADQCHTSFVCNSCREQQGHTIKYDQFLSEQFPWKLFSFFSVLFVFLLP